MRPFLFIMRPHDHDIMGTYARPTTVGEALDLRAAGAVILAGGTDFWPGRAGGLTNDPLDHAIVDLGGIADLRRIAPVGSGWRIGAAATWTDIAEAALPAAFAGLQSAARQIGGRQIQNCGTIGGNLCNASPAADGVPPLLTLDAEVELASRTGRRTLPLREFLIGPRRTAMRADEVLTAVLVPPVADHAHAGFRKLGSRSSLLISIVMVAGMIEFDEERRVRRSAIAVGACSPVAMRLSRLEQELCGAPSSGLDRRLSADHFASLAPIDDVRADAAYRREAAMVEVARLLRQLEGVA